MPLVKPCGGGPSSDEHSEQRLARQRIVHVIRANISSIVASWLEAVKREPEIGSILISDSERSQNLPELLWIASNIAEGKHLPIEDRNTFLEHGALRYKQKYTAQLLDREARVLQSSVAECIQRNLANIAMLHLVPDTIRFMTRLDSLWKVAARALVRQAYAEIPANRAPAKKVIT